MKKAMLLFVVFFAFSCGVTTTHHLKIQPEKLTNVKRVIIIPLYMDKNFIPNENFDKYLKDEDRNYLIEKINSKRENFNKAAFDILKTSRFKFNPSIEESINNKDVYANIIVNKDRFANIKTKKIFPDNYSYLLKTEYIKDIANKYKADAVYFHYIQSRRTWSKETNYLYNSGAYRTYYIVPMEKVFYGVVIYDKNGKIILNNHEKGELFRVYNASDYLEENQTLDLYALQETTFDKSKITGIKIPNFKRHFEARNLKYPDRLLWTFFEKNTIETRLKQFVFNGFH